MAREQTAAAEPASRRVELPTGLGYHVLEWGADDGARDHTVVLVHGFLDLAAGWAPVVRAGLGARFHVVAPDMRGHGDSDRVGAGGYYHFMDYLADLRGVIDALGRARVSLVGHSMGGSICSYYAGTYPDEVHRLALLEGTGPPERTTPMPERARTWIQAWRKARSRPPKRYPTVEDAAARLRKHDALLSEDLALELARAGTAPVDGGGVAFKHDPLHLTMGPYPFRVDAASQFWKAITAPVLLVEGDQSVFRHAEEENARRRGFFARSEHAVIPGAAHMMMRHQPERLAELLAGFLGE